MMTLTHHRTMFVARAALACACALAAAPSASAQQINLYTTREPGLIKPLVDAFTKRGGELKDLDAKSAKKADSDDEDDFGD